MAPPHATSAGVAAALSLSLAALSAAPAAGVPALADTRPSWTVGFAGLQAGGLPEGEAYLAWSIPLMLRDQLGGISEHAVGDEERVDLGRTAMARARAVLLSEIAGLRGQRDAESLAEPLAATPSSVTPSAAQRLADALERLAALEATDPAAVSVPDRKPLELKDGPGPGRLFAPPVASEAALCAAHDLDLLVGGSLREIEGNLLLDLWAFDAARGRRVFVYREVTARDELYGLLGDIGRSLAGVLLGRPWAALAVSATPPGASVLLDGQPPPAGRSRWDELEPGPHTVSVAAAGHLPEERWVDLAPSTETEISVELEPIDAGTIAVASDPPGAEAWLDAVWKGRTPFDLPRPPETSRLVLKAPGRYDASVAVGPTSPPTLAVTLGPDIGSREELQRAARDRFYRAFGWFIVSLPVPFFAYGWSSDWAAQASRLWISYPDEAERAVVAATGLYWAYVGGMVVSSSLASWMVVELVRYVRAAGRLGD